jgi:broad specificity phosphatase PhoE
VSLSKWTPCGKVRSYNDHSNSDLIILENSDSPCDTGSELNTIAEEFPQLDFTKVDPVFPDKSGNTPYAFTRSAITARGQSCLAKLYERPEQAIAVVSHSGFLRTVISKRRYANADYRVFTFRRSKSGHLSLVEDRTTAKRGGGMGMSEKGFQKIEPWDFPREDLVAAAIRDHVEQVS